MPPGIKQPGTLYTDPRLAIFQLIDLYQSLLQVLTSTKDSDQVLHHLLQIAMHCVRVFAIAALEGDKRIALREIDLVRIERRRGCLPGVVSGSQARAPAEDQQIG